MYKRHVYVTISTEWPNIIDLHFIPKCVCVNIFRPIVNLQTPHMNLVYLGSLHMYLWVGPSAMYELIKSLL